jgi:hypothetical protein
MWEGAGSGLDIPMGGKGLDSNMSRQGEKTRWLVHRASVVGILVPYPMWMVRQDGVGRRRWGYLWGETPPSSVLDLSPQRQDQGWQNLSESL